MNPEKKTNKHPGSALSPLDDPIFEAIFQDVNSSGLALQNLVNAVLISNNESPIQEVMSLVTQKSFSMVGQRGCRLDLEAKTEDNSWVNIEVQLYTEPYISDRNIFHISRMLSSYSAPGDDIAQMSDRMPRMIVISLVDFEIREDHPDFDQSAHIRFDKAPHSIFNSKVGFYFLQLPKFANGRKDWQNPLHCWLYAIYTAHTEGKLLKEVVQMHEELKKFYEMDTGFEQFVTRHNLVATDPETLRHYYRWLNNMQAQFNVLHGAHEEGLAKGIEQGLALAIAVFDMLAKGLPDTQIRKTLDISDEKLAEIKKKYNAMKH